jgi:hypothetical protein
VIIAILVENLFKLDFFTVENDENHVDFSNTVKVNQEISES